MKVYCVKERRFTPNVTESEKITTTKNGRKLLRVKCASCRITKTRFLPGNKRSGEGLVDILKMAGKVGYKLGKDKRYKRMGVLGATGSYDRWPAPWEV